MSIGCVLTGKWRTRQTAKWGVLAGWGFWHTNSPKTKLLELLKLPTQVQKWGCIMPCHNPLGCDDMQLCYLHSGGGLGEESMCLLCATDGRLGKCLIKSLRGNAKKYMGLQHRLFFPLPALTEWYYIQLTAWKITVWQPFICALMKRGYAGNLCLHPRKGSLNLNRYLTF